MITPESKHYKGDRKEYPKNFIRYATRNRGCKIVNQDREKDRRKRQIEKGSLKVANGLVE